MGKALRVDHGRHHCLRDGWMKEVMSLKETREGTVHEAGEVPREHEVAEIKGGENYNSC